MIGKIGENDLTIQWNTDGVQIFNTSKWSIWPIQIMINELPYNIRNKNIILSSVWFAESKPPMNMFLKPFIDELRELENVGFISKTIFNEVPVLIKVHTLCASVDSIARPVIQNQKQFNGLFGCSFCVHPGEIVINTKSTRIYPGSLQNLRSRSFHLNCLKKIKQSNRPVKGIKRPTVLLLLKNFSPAEDCPPDYLHCVLEGVTKLVFSLWFLPRYNSKPWYLGLSKKEVNRRIKLIKPCCEIKRNIRSLDKWKMWTAAEWKYFLLYYSLPCLQEILGEVYFEHWFLLVYSINMLSQRNVSNENIEIANAVINEFVEKFESLYGKEHMRYNVHLLLHIVPSVQRFGALWAWSNFPFETFNGVLKSLFKGSQSVPDQIAKVYSRLKHLKQFPNDFSKIDCNEKAKTLFCSLMKESNVSNNFLNGDELVIKCKPTTRVLSDSEKVALKNYFGIPIPGGPIQSSNRFSYKNIRFHGYNYHKSMKRLNSIIQIQSGSIMNISELVYFHELGQNYIIFGKKMERYENKLCSYNDWNSENISTMVMETNTLVCCLLHDFVHKCVLVPCYNEGNCDKFYSFPLVNQIERD